MLYIQLLERMSLIALVAYIFSHTKLFRVIIKEKVPLKDKILIIIFFSIFAIIGTYTGINIKYEALANTRPIGAIMAGYLGGPIVGMIVGAIAGFHRYTLGGFTALACGVATVLEGLIGGSVKKFFNKGQYNMLIGFFSGVLAEVSQMIVILLLSKPYERAVELVKLIGLPMILINSLGVVVFINIIKNTNEQFNRIRANYSQKALSIARQTISYMRKGFNKDTADSVAGIVYEVSNLPGVFIGDNEKILTYYGDTEVDLNVLNSGLIEYFKKPYSGVIEIQGMNFYCSPLYIRDNDFQGVIGVKFYENSESKSYFIEFCREMAELLSTQIELYKLNKIANAASIAELRALRAQIHPHFLFNALNTISSFCRTNPLRARELILDLSNYFRKTLNRTDDFIQLSEEIDLINSYLSIEKARFGDRLKLYIDIPEKLLTMKVPIFVIQPLVENAIKHGISPKALGGTILIKAQESGNEVVFSVEDTGIGMSRDRYDEVVSTWPGVGLKNVNDRLKLLYGEQSILNIESSIEEGTRVIFKIPMEVHNGINNMYDN
ncbi:sensor histidine kinase [Fervidicella metallireducens AeB]|uniref:Sensor histidine kinase n=1 Tax=Fervidicella metallireducens AeB TaxID=1403537 RepID=A0A017RT32_9CLOT|nr:LytS/YhcK type 5TM receptor domain-containing protein [Fervidicella metallireducens]EYE87776.1 sensor histidine kinase [Fervidicella metallireducens AeB]